MQRVAPSGFLRILYFHWLLLVVIFALVGIGLIMLYAIANGNPDIWMRDQAIRFGIGLIAIFLIAFTPQVFWQYTSILGYLFIILLLILTLLIGVEVKGSQRWLQIAGIRLQASEFMKLALILAIASYYSFLPPERVSNPIFMLPPMLMTLIPAGLIFLQPDLGTALFLILLGAAMMFLAGVNIWYFIVGLVVGVGLIFVVFESRGTDWQLINDYQYDRIDVFLDPTLDPSDKGYQIIQSKIALGSGGVNGRTLEGATQSQLDFLPENHTDFIFTSYAESFGYVGTIVLLMLFGLLNIMIAISAAQNKDRFGALVTGGVGVMIFLFYMVNMAMVMGMAPVVGLSLPFVSYGGSTMLILCAAIGFVQNSHINRKRVS